MPFRTPLSRLVVVASVALAACGDDEEVSPLGSGGATSASSTAAGATTSSGSPTSSTSQSSGEQGGGGEGGAGGSGGHYDGECTPLAIGDTWVYFEGIARTGVEARVAPQVEGLAKTRLTLELYEDDGSGTLGPVEPGTFELGVAPDDNYGTCQHCVLLVASDDAGQPKRAFFAKNGTMHVETIDEFDWTILVGSVEATELTEVTQDEDFTWHEVPGGDCWYVDEWTFDTVPVDGGPCESAEECPNLTQQICEPQTGVCGPPQCSLTFDPPFCPDGQGCFSQLFDPDQGVSGPAIGACYDLCDPEAPNDCGEGETCRPLGPTQSLGVCYRTGDAEIGDECVPRDISTECVEGAVCTGEDGHCARICSFLTEEAGCDAGTACTLADLCEPIDVGDEAAIGEVCATSSPELFECGVEGDAFRGLCMKFFLEDLDLVCERLCRTAEPACPDDEECLGLFSNPEVGICRAPAECGDGNVDVIGGEICDDGGTDDGDGCSADCTTPELPFLCDDAAVLALDLDLAGTTVGGITGYPSACDPYIATPVATYAFTPPADGELRLELTNESDADLGISVLGDCADGASELRCATRFGDDELFLDVVVTEPILVVVRGASPNQAGAFTLRASYRVAVCGDGETDGDEVCDDGNEDDGDGCSGDCSAIDWEALCAGLPELVLGDTEGTTAGGSSTFDLAGICSFVGGGGRERAYVFEAPADGVLSLELAQPEADLSLFVQDGCGPSSDDVYLSCSNGAFPGSPERTAVELTEGQVVTVVVDGFTQADVGEFTLTAAFED